MSAEDVLNALDGVRQVLADETRPEEDFYSAADEFLLVFHAHLDEGGGDPPPLDEWDPRPALLLLAIALTRDEELDPGYFAAARAVHDSLEAAGRELARLN